MANLVKIGIKQKFMCKKFLIEKPQQQPFFHLPSGLLCIKTLLLQFVDMILQFLDIVVNDIV